ncbi:MAG: Rieske 2Fe-2S domain-containing protein [Actinomycetota bacterium]|nr:Rieske 2Fe-2S domain-containing protein [Actinomycetota bacterium]
MADDLERPGDEGERHDPAAHLPSPSIWPFGFALGVALVLLGLIVSWPVAAVGAAIAIVFGFLWIRAATQEVRGKPAPPVKPSRVEDEEEEEPARYPRSVFLEGATLGIGAAIGGIVTVPALGFAVLPAFVGQEYGDIDLGPLENFPEGDFVIAKFRSDRDEPDEVARRTAYIRNNGIANDVPSFTILSSRCVHLGCPVQPQGLSEEPREIETESGKVEIAPTAPSGFGCPCHGGAYDTEGNRTAGPPVRALDRYSYSIKNGRLVLGKPYSVGKVVGTGADAKIKAYDIADPGQHVDGPEQFFYPYIP